MAEPGLSATAGETNDGAEPVERPHTRDYFQIDPHVFTGLIPVGVFLVANYFGPAQIAIALSFVASAIVFVRNRGHGAVRMLSVLGFTIVSVSAAIGLATNSDRAFAAQNIVADFIFAGVFTASVLLRRPFIGAIAHEAAPGIAPVMPLDHAIFVRLTLISAGLNLVTGVARIFLFQSLTVNEYIIASRVLGAPLTIAFIIYCFYAITRTAIEIWPADLEPPSRGRAGRARGSASPPGV